MRLNSHPYIFFALIVRRVNDYADIFANILAKNLKLVRTILASLKGAQVQIYFFTK